MRFVSALLVGVVGLWLPGLSGGSAEAAPPTCFGRTVTIMGTNGPDTLVGRADVSDVIYGGGGNDYIHGTEDFYDSGSAPDFLCGGPGNDTVRGGQGNDRLNGGDGDDTVNGENGADLEQGNAGNDIVGQDSFADSDRAADVVNGGPGHDALIVGWGRDRMIGGRGNDRFDDTECDGPTVMFGGPGRDHFASWRSSFDAMPCNEVADRIYGGRGRDSAVVDRRDSLRRVERVTLKP